MTRDLVADIQDFQMRLVELQTAFNQACRDYDIERMLRITQQVNDLITESRVIVNLTYSEEQYADYEEVG